MSAPEPVSALLPPSMDLLARAALSPLPEARRAWEGWRQNHDLDRTPWAEVRLLGALARRLDELEPGADIAPRLKGIQKFLWVNSQACLLAASAGIAQLVRAGIPCLLMKGAARIAEDKKAVSERLIRDVDVLVPYELAREAYDQLVASRWLLTGWQLEPYHEAPFASHHAWALSQGKSELDVHHFSNTLNRLVGDDDALWSRARALDWNGTTVHLPAPSDALLIALVHGVRFSGDGNADWVIDAARLLRSGAIDWDVFLDEARSRCVAAIAWTGLAYLEGILGAGVPASVLAALDREVSPAQLAELKSYMRANWPRNAEEETALGRAAIERVLRKAFGPAGAPAFDPTHLKRFGIRPFTLEPGVHDIRVEVDRAALGGPFGVLQTLIQSPALLIQSGIELIYTAPGLPLGRARASVDGHNTARFELPLPSALLGLRRIDYLKLSIFLPAHAGHKSAAVQTAWFG